MPYFKRVLIPFGEYMPLASYFSGLKELNAKAGVFSAGTQAVVFAYPMHRPDGTAYTLKVSPLICYEDTVPALARESVGQGAELLVNITSDSWFGRTLAPHQHHLIAAFRAIENRRYLIRATNTGLSAVVDPLGKTIARIPPFSEGTATAQVRLLELSEHLYQRGRRPPLVGPPRIEHWHGCREAMARVTSARPWAVRPAPVSPCAWPRPPAPTRCSCRSTDSRTSRHHRHWSWGSTTGRRAQGNALSPLNPELRRFAEGIRRDKAAVRAAVTGRWSNGPVVGHVNRLKTIKRQMYGRAGFVLLRARGRQRRLRRRNGDLSSIGPGNWNKTPVTISHEFDRVVRWFQTSGKGDHAEQEEESTFKIRYRSYCPQVECGYSDDQHD